MASRSDESPGELEFKTVVCGVDDSPQSAVVTGQAPQLGAADGHYWIVSAWDPSLAWNAGIHAGAVVGDLREQAVSALRRAAESRPRMESMLLKGRDVPSLLAAISNLRADLVCVGSHGRSRSAGILFGSVASAMTHHAPCSVLIAREPPAGEFPGTILHANDGSPESLQAARVAGELAARHDATVVTVNVGEGGSKDIAEQAVVIIERSGREPRIVTEHGSPHRRLVEVADEVRAGLVVMGSRGQTGVAALGSVSERVSHRAPCSVLIVRPAVHPTAEDDW